MNTYLAEVLGTFLLTENRRTLFLELLWFNEKARA